MSTIERVEAPATMPVVLDPRVERGAALLDGLRPGWADEIDLDDFDLTNGCRCVLGQIGLCVWDEAYIPTAVRLLPDGEAYGEDAYSHGFVGDTDGDLQAQKRDWALLEQDWRLAILSRRSV